MRNQLKERLAIRNKEDKFYPVQGDTQAVRYRISISCVRRPLLFHLLNSEIIHKKPTKISINKIKSYIDRLESLKEKFEKRFGEVFDASESEGLYLYFTKILFQIYGKSDLTDAGMESIEYTLQVMEEVYEGNYCFEEALVYVNWSIQVSRSFLLGGPLEKQEKVDRLFHRIVKEPSSYYLVERPKIISGHSLAFFIMDQETHRPFAILKRTFPLHLSSFAQRVPLMKRSAPLHELERIGFEMNKIIGVFQHTPVTMQAKFLVNGEEAEGSIQEYIRNSFAGRRDFYYLDSGAKELMTLPNGVVHSAILEGFIQQRGAGHGDNIIVTKRSCQGKTAIDRLYAIDLEEILPRYMRLNPAIFFKDAEAAKDYSGRDFDEEIYGMLTLCRIWLLGLPQGNRKVSRALLLMGSHPSIIRSVNEYADLLYEASGMEKEGIDALRKRVILIQEICSHALQTKISITPREMYFRLFGGRKLYDAALMFGISPIEIFDQVLGNPYPNFESFSDIEKSLESLKEFVIDKSRTKEEIALMKRNFEKLYRFEKE